jgi:hypothetical protein
MVSRVASYGNVLRLPQILVRRPQEITLGPACGTAQTPDSEVGPQDKMLSSSTDVVLLDNSDFGCETGIAVYVRHILKQQGGDRLGRRVHVVHGTMSLR